VKRAILVIAIAGATTLARADAPVSPGQGEFEAATQLEAKGDYAAAADALEKLGRARPDDPFADDALFEAALISEEHLSDPTRAARLYEKVAHDYPSSRLARRARARADFLSMSLKTGEAPLREYQDILNGFARRPHAESLARMEKLLAEHPGFALADRALYWLGATWLDERRPDLAVRNFLAVEERFPNGEWAARAKKARADLLLRTGHPLEARRLYDQLGTSSDLLARAAGREGVAQVRSSIRRAIVWWLAVAYVIAFLLLHARTLARLRAWRVPTELWFYLPVAGLFVIAGVTENLSILIATGTIAVGGGLIVWASCGVTAAELDRGTLTLRTRLGRVAAAAAAVLCVMYVAVQSTGLTDLMIETLRSGPER
jgi:tetratricopeptide (TPR) repeat protein